MGNLKRMNQTNRNKGRSRRSSMPRRSGRRTENRLTRTKASSVYGSSRARAMARRKARLRKRRMMAAGVLLAGVLGISGLVYGIAGGGDRKEKEAFLEHGIVCMEQKDYEAAITEFEKELKLSKGRIGEAEQQALLYRGEAEYRLGDYEAALHTYQILLEKDRKNELYRKGAALAMIETGDYKGALELDVENAHAYSRMAKDLIEDGRYEEAQAAIEQGKASVLPETSETVKAELAFHEAIVWEYQSDYQKALELFESYVETYGSDQRAEREILFLKTRQGKH